MAIWNSALVKQRAGQYAEAEADYNIFLASAEQIDAPPGSVAEVHVNLGQIRARQADRAGARAHFLEALRFRNLGSAHVNLALLALAEGQAAPGRMDARALEEALWHCEAALQAGDSGGGQVKSIAEKIMGDALKSFPEGHVRRPYQGYEGTAVE
eukprot:CAMPEP_0172588864 /NCGR_PEP_ID=MMETSP1068-20121228/7705_1 /TAXON_ID=35684 /ORGANISM="Pseudopedinella elastica, Strain CCMP716" /LENGTH=154 /DNA_ID=CAMNT_0013384321 /DNA_START=141 /DNA_END=605 /DNA_ORIENTATION=-